MRCALEAANIGRGALSGVFSQVGSDIGIGIRGRATECLSPAGFTLSYHHRGLEQHQVLNSEISFKPVDFVAKPPLKDLFGLGGIQSGDGSALRIERNMVTRDIFAFARLGDGTLRSPGRFQADTKNFRRND
jgi:hypothetical protein